LSFVKLPNGLEQAKNIGLAQILNKRAQGIVDGIWKYGQRLGVLIESLPYEVDGYGGQVLMDDANVPSFTGTANHGFPGQIDKTYQNTRKMLLSKDTNPYYLERQSLPWHRGRHRSNLCL